jgi:hypothetical protein
VENVLSKNKNPPSFHLLSVALSETGEELKEPMGQRSMANSLVGGNINSRKTRSLLFVKVEQKPDQNFQGINQNYYLVDSNLFVACIELLIIETVYL